MIRILSIFFFLCCSLFAKDKISKQEYLNFIDKCVIHFNFPHGCFRGFPVDANGNVDGYCYAFITSGNFIFLGTVLRDTILSDTKTQVSDSGWINTFSTLYRRTFIQIDSVINGNFIFGKIIGIDEYAGRNEGRYKTIIKNVETLHPGEWWAVEDNFDISFKFSIGLKAVFITKIETDKNILIGAINSKSNCLKEYLECWKQSNKIK
jgi:hypothetical protein